MKALVLSSGGVDSTTCLAMAIDALGSDNVSALSIWYGQKHKKELEKIQKDLDAKNAELSKIKTDEIKRTTLAKYKMPDKFLDRISGANEEEIEASVKCFAETMGEYIKSLGASGVPGAMNGGSSGIDKKAKLEELRQKAYESGSEIDRANYTRAKQELENSGGNE